MACSMANAVRPGLSDLPEGVDLSNPKEVRSLLIKLTHARKSTVYDTKIRRLHGVIVNSIMENYNSAEGELDMAITPLIPSHPDYAFLAGRVSAYMTQINTPKTFTDAVYGIQMAVGETNGFRSPMKPVKGGLSDEIVDFVNEHGARLDGMIDDVRDYSHNYMGITGLLNGVAIKVNKKLYERPQYVFMRVAMAMTDLSSETALEDIWQTYMLISGQCLSMASPVLFNGGTSSSNTASCFLLDMGDNMVSITKKVAQTMTLIAKNGGIGINFSKLRATGSKIGMAGKSSGIGGKLNLFDRVAQSVDQGENKRPGAIAGYLTDWHADMYDWLYSRYNGSGNEVNKRHVLNMGLVMSDLFMERVENDKEWSLFSPNDVVGLEELYGEKFVRAYRAHEANPKIKRTTVSARKLFSDIANMMWSTGEPYILFKDAVNERSNHKHLGTIKNSNLCCEIVQYCDTNEIAVCNLATICVSNFVNVETGEIDFEGIADAAGVACKGINNLIDKQNYDLGNEQLMRLADERTEEVVEVNGIKFDAKYNLVSYSNLKHRPQGIGMQGLHDVFMKLKIPYDSEMAFRLAALIQEAIYYGAVRESVKIAEEKGPYPSYYWDNNTHREGKLQFDFLEGFDRDRDLTHELFNWREVLKKFEKFGINNSELTAQPPSASSSQLNDNVESIEAITSNRFTKGIKDGKFIIINKHLQKDLEDLGMWDAQMVGDIEANDGSIQNIERIPKNIREIYKTAREIDHKAVVKLCAAIQPFIDQTISKNMFVPKNVDNPVQLIMENVILGHKMKLKTGMYYTRGIPAMKQQNFGKMNFQDKDIGKPVPELVDCEACSA
ncbi:ORF50 [Chlamys acute necrobiotic virus]|nr:ORF50 [Chlamys acute necrobiotic virus]